MKTQNICLEDIRDLIMTRTDEIRRMTDNELAMELLCVLRNLLKSDKVCNDCTLACLQKESEGSYDGE